MRVLVLERIIWVNIWGKVVVTEVWVFEYVSNGSGEFRKDLNKGLMWCVWILYYRLVVFWDIINIVACLIFI